MTHRTRLRRDDDGSIILSLLAIMIVSGLLLVVAGTVINGQQQSRFDRGFEQALLVAEVGQNQMVSLIQSNPAGDDFPPMTGETSNGGTYTVSAVKDGVSWTVTSTGDDASGRSRTVESEVLVRPLFALAAFGKTLVDFNGGNGSDSFDSALGTNICRNGSSADYVPAGTPTNANTNETDVNMCLRTGLGTVATNGELVLKGGVAARIDRAEVHNAREHVEDPLPDATGFCGGVTETCNLRTATPKKLFHYREPIELPAINACDTAEAPTPYDGSARVLGGRVYQFTDATLTGNTVFTGTIASPTILCVSGRLTIANHHLINFEQHTYPDGVQRWRPRRPGTLMIFVTGSSNSGVVMGNSASISAGIYAPNAAVNCGPQGNVYGALIANSIDNAGGWNFHYDDALGAQMLNAPVRVQNWREVQS